MDSEKEDSPQAKNPFLGFLEEYGALAAGLFGVASAPHIAGLLKIAPPSPPAPPNLEVFATLITMPILIGCFWYLRDKSGKIAKIVRPSALFFLTLFSISYIYIYTSKTIMLPTADSSSIADSSPIAKVIEKRIVIGNECTHEAKLLYPQQCKKPDSLLDPKILQDFSSGGLPESLWEFEGVRFNSNILVGCWIGLVSSVTACVGMLISKK